MLIQNPKSPTYLDAATKTIWNPLHLPKRIQKAIALRDNVVCLAMEYGTGEEDQQTISFCLMLSSGILVMYDVSREDVLTPFELNNSGSPQVARIWENDELVFSMQWNWRGVFQLDLFEKGRWIKQLRKALARPDLHLI